MAIDLEKRSGADAVRRTSALINEMIGSVDRETLRIAGSFQFAGTNSYKHDAAGLWQRGPEVRGKLFGSVRDFGRAMDLRQQLRVIRVGKEFNLANPVGDFAGAPNLPHRVNRAVDQGRADGALLNRQ